MNEENSILSYWRIRRTIGYLGISLPILLLILPYFDFFETSRQPSISHYYYTNLRELFTGTLCAVGLFLIRYKGFENPSILKNDKLLTNIAGIMAFGTALFPTNPNWKYEKMFTLIPYNQEYLGWIHYGFAAVLFLTFSLLSINVFTIGQNSTFSTTKSIFNENNIYKICGYSIVVFVILIPICAALKLFTNSTLVFEALSLFAFGIAWLIKGRALGYGGVLGQKLYNENNENKSKVFY